jgi:cyclopropane-fatty-acyl-phospholipid synthase
MLLHCIVASSKAELAERNLPVTMQLLRFIKFIIDDIFPGGRLPLVAMVEEHAARAGFAVSRVQPLQQHYARTLDLWSAALESRRDEAIAIQSTEVYDQYMRYLTGCAELFRDGYTNVCQFTLDKSPRR